MEEGSTARNAVVALGYVLLSPLVIFFGIVLLPFVAAYKVYRGKWSEKLSSLPGIEPGGGAIPAVVAFVYAFVLLGVAGAVLPGGDTGDAPDEATAAMDGTPSADERRTADATATPAQTDGGTDVAVTDSADPTATPDPTPTPTATPEPTLTATPEPTPTATATPEEISEADVSAVLVSQGIDVVFFQRNSNEERGYILAYESQQTTQEGIAREMGTVAGTWAAFVDANGADGLGEGLIVQVREVNGEPAGYYEIKTEWAVQYNSGELTSEEYSTLILQSLEVEE